MTLYFREPVTPLFIYSCLILGNKINPFFKLNVTSEITIFIKKTMDTQTLLILIAIGTFAGVLSGFVGVGGGIIIVPALVYVLGMSQHEAQGTSLFVLLLPVGILAVHNYYKSDQINWKFGLVISLAFVLGGYFGSRFALKISPAVVRIIFGIVMAVVSFKMITSGINTLSNDS